MRVTLWNGNCLELMGDIADNSIDMILCDLPYGVTQAKWDTVIPFDLLWEQYERVIKDNGAIVLFAQGLFTSNLMQSNSKLWRYNLIWNKGLTSGFLNANRMPMRSHEDICVFYKNLPTYNPIMTKGKPSHSKGKMLGTNNRLYGKHKQVEQRENSEMKHPKSIINIQTLHPSRKIHPSQKPVALLEYLIKTYTNENDTVLDNTMGSGSTGVACVNLNRKFIGIELDENYFNIAKGRMEESQLFYEITHPFQQQN